MPCPYLSFSRGVAVRSFVLAIVVATSAAQAVTRLPIEDADTPAFDQLTRTYDLHIDAVAELVEKTPMTKRPTSATLGKLAHRWRQATIAWMDYAWKDDRGRTVHRTYRGISGREPWVVLGLDTAEGSGGGLHGANWPLANARPHAGSVLTVAEGVRLNDAEVKLLRSLEADILDGSASRGGRVSLWASQQACSSCAGLARQLEDAYGARVTIYELRRAPKADPAAAFSRLDAYRKDGFHRMRDGISARQRGSFGMPRPLVGICPP